MLVLVSQCAFVYAAVSNLYQIAGRFLAKLASARRSQSGRRDRKITRLAAGASLACLCVLAGRNMPAQSAGVGAYYGAAQTMAFEGRDVVAVAADTSGNLYVADSSGNIFRSAPGCFSTSCQIAVGFQSGYPIQKIAADPNGDVFYSYTDYADLIGANNVYSYLYEFPFTGTPSSPSYGPAVHVSTWESNAYGMTSGYGPDPQNGGYYAAGLAVDGFMNILVTEFDDTVGNLGYDASHDQISDEGRLVQYVYNGGNPGNNPSCGQDTSIVYLNPNWKVCYIQNNPTSSAAVDNFNDFYWGDFDEFGVYNAVSPGGPYQPIQSPSSWFTVDTWHGSECFGGGYCDASMPIATSPDPFRNVFTVLGTSESDATAYTVFVDFYGNWENSWTLTGPLTLSDYDNISSAIDPDGNFLISGTGGGALRLHTGAVDFGSVPVGQQTSPPVELPFYFTQPEVLQKAVVAQSGIGTAKEFIQGSISGGGTNCASGTWQPGDSCQVVAAFSPAYPGLQTGAAQLLDPNPTGAPLAEVTLRGIGTAPMITYPPSNPSGTTPLPGNHRDPQGVAVDANGDVFVAETANNQVIEVPAPCSDSSCVVTWNGFSAPTAVAVDGHGNVFVAEDSDVREIVALDGLVNAQSMIQAVGNLSLPKNNCGLAIFSQPRGLAVDKNGNVLVADSGIGILQIRAMNGQVIPNSECMVRRFFASEK